MQVGHYLFLPAVHNYKHITLKFRALSALGQVIIWLYDSDTELHEVYKAGCVLNQSVDYLFGSHICMFNYIWKHVVLDFTKIIFFEFIK